MNIRQTQRRKKPAAKPEAKPARRNGINTAVFIEKYIATLNAATAAKAAGSKAKNLYVAGHEFLRKPNVSAELQRVRSEAMAKVGMSADRTLRELARVCFYDPRKFFHDDGTPKNIDELDEDTAAALVGLDVKQVVTGQGKDRVTVITKKCRFADKIAALDKAMRHLGLYEQDNNQGAEALARVVFKISAKTKGPR